MYKHIYADDNITKERILIFKFNGKPHNITLT